MTGESNLDETQGQVFVFAIPAFDKFESSSPRLAVTTSSRIPVDVTLSIRGSSIKMSMTVNRNNHSDIVLPQMIRLGKEEGKQNKTIIVRSNGKVSVHVMNDGDNGDGFVVYPTSHLGKRYYVAAYSVNTAVDPSLVIISSIENTQIIITKKAGDSFSVRLENFESYRFDGDRFEDLSETLIESEKPIAVISGVKTQVPRSQCCLGVLLKQLLPVSEWGKKYFLAPVTGLNGFVFRVYMSNLNTAVNISRSEYDRRNHEIKHELEADSFHEEIVDGNTLVSITSTEPIMVVQYLKGYDTDLHLPGNPSMIVVQPLESFTNNVTFPVFDNNLSYQNNNKYYINIIVECSRTSGLRYSRQMSDVSLAVSLK